MIELYPDDIDPFAFYDSPIAEIAVTPDFLQDDPFGRLAPEIQAEVPQEEPLSVQSFGLTEDTLQHDLSLARRMANVPLPTYQHEQEMWSKLDEFNKKAWSAKNRGVTTGWKSIDKAFDNGLQPGFIIIGGDSNLGKSGFITQMSQQIAELNPDVYVMDFSLDDPMPDKVARIVGSINRVILNAVKTPNNYVSQPGLLVRRETGLQKLYAMSGRYQAYDANFSTYCEDIEQEIERIQVLLTAEQQDRKLVVCIDNMHDLNLKNSPGMTDKTKYDTIAQWCSDLAIRKNLILIASAELKKLNGIRRPALDDIREAVKIKYEAKAVLLVYNEVHYKGENAQIYFSRKNDPLRQPVFEVHFAKNKFHTFKGRVFFEFYPEMARFEEADVQSAKTYASVVFGS